MLSIVIGLSIFAYEKSKLSKQIAFYSNEYKKAEELQRQRYADLRNAMVQNDIAKCRKLESKEKNECFLAYSLKNRTIDSCKEIAIPEDALNCEDAINTINFVENNESISRCASLSNASSTLLCYHSFIDSWLGKGKSADCENKELPAELQANCRARFALVAAVTSNNVADCDKIQEKPLSDQCKENIKLLPPDKDGDGLSDRDEKSYGLDFDNPDTDGDGLIDGEEINRFRTNPLSKDTDGDTLSDKNEVSLGTNPANVDTDGDGFTDSSEISKSFNPCGEGPLPDKDQLKKDCEKYYKQP